MGGGTKSKSYNKAYDTISGATTPVLGNIAGAANQIQALLGGDASGFEKFKKATGYDWALDRGTGDVLAKRAAVGGLDSGATLKGLQQFQSGLQNQYASGYLDKLLGLGNLGLGAGGLLTTAGQVSSSKSKGGLGSALGGVGSLLSGAASAGAFSDRRLKENIKKIGELPNSLNLYEYNYTARPLLRQVGVMADEVAVIQPEALGPVVDGYSTVDYSKIKGWSD